MAQKSYGPDHALRGVIRRSLYAGAQKEPFDIIPTVEGHDDLRKLFRSEGNPGHIGGTTVHAVSTVIDALVGIENLEKRNAAPIGSPGMANPCGRSVSEGSSAPGSSSARRTGNIVFGGFSEDREFLHKLHGIVPPSEPGEKYFLFSRSIVQCSL